MNTKKEMDDASFPEDRRNPPKGQSLSMIFEPMYSNDDGFEHDLHQIDTVQTGYRGHFNKRYRIHWGEYKGVDVVVKIPRDGSALQIEENRPFLQREIDAMKSLIHPNLLRLVAYDDTTLVAERFGYSATIINDYLEMATIAHGCITALEYIHTREPCLKHGNVVAKRIFLEKNKDDVITRVVLGGLSKVTVCTDNTPTASLGYTSDIKTSRKSDDIVSLSVTLMNAYFNTIVPKDVGVYITYDNYDTISRLMDYKVVDVLHRMIKDAGTIPANGWTGFLNELKSKWSNIMNSANDLTNVSSVNPSILKDYGPRVASKNMRRGLKASRSRKEGIKNFNISMGRGDLDDVHEKHPPNHSYSGIITVGFMYNHIDNDDNVSEMNLSDLGGGDGLDSRDLNDHDADDNMSDSSFRGLRRGEQDLDLSGFEDLVSGSGSGMDDQEDLMDISLPGMGSGEIDPSGLNRVEGDFQDIVLPGM